MASFRFTKLKITIGYILLLAILLFSLVFVHQEMETLSAADDQQNLRTDSLLTLLHEKDQNTLQMLRVLSEANDSLLSASEIEEIISEQQDYPATGTASGHYQTRFFDNYPQKERLFQTLGGSVRTF